MGEYSTIRVSKETKKALDEIMESVPFISSYENLFKYLKIGFDLYEHGIRVKTLFPEKTDLIHIIENEVD